MHLFIFLRRWIAILLCGSAIAVAMAHDPGLSTVTLQLRPGAIDAVVSFSLKDAEALIGANSSRPSTPAALSAAVRDAVDIVSDQPSARTEIVGCHFEGSSNATVRLRVAAEKISTLQFRSKCFARLPTGHRQFVTIQNESAEVIAERLLSANADSVTVELKNANTSASPAAAGNLFRDFLLLGMKHILTGYDHLLFLFSLLLVTRKFSTTLKIISAFTLAHSITLALAALNIVRVPASIVEPIIAASIIYVGIENIVRGEMPKGRVLLTFAFGLIHGLGFASALREAGLGANGSGPIAPLVSFNLGVELGQLLVAAVALPFIWKITAHPALARRWVPACSAIVILAGSYWLVQRLCFS